MTAPSDETVVATPHTVTISELALLVLAVVGYREDEDDAVTAQYQIPDGPLTAVCRSASWKHIVTAVGRFKDAAPNAFTNQVIERLYSYGVMWTMCDLDEEDYDFMREAYRALHKDGLDATFPVWEARELAAREAHNQYVSEAWTTFPHFFRDLILAMATDGASETIVPVQLVTGTDAQQVAAWKESFVQPTDLKADATTRFRVRCHGNESGNEFPDHVLSWLSTPSVTCARVLARRLWVLVSGGASRGDGPACLPGSPIVQLRWSIDDEQKKLPSLRILVSMNLTPVTHNAVQCVMFDEDTSRVTVLIAASSSDEPMSLPL